MSKAEVYTLAKLQGLGTRAAAREAGFADGRPTPQARDMWRRSKPCASRRALSASSTWSAPSSSPSAPASTARRMLMPAGSPP